MGRPTGWRTDNPKNYRIPAFRVSDEDAAWLKSEMERRKAPDAVGPIGIADLMRRIIKEAREKQEKKKK